MTKKDPALLDTQDYSRTLLHLANTHLVQRLLDLPDFKPTRILIIGTKDWITTQLSVQYPNAIITFVNSDDYCSEVVTHDSLFQLVYVCCMPFEGSLLKPFLEKLYDNTQVGGILLLATLGIGSLLPEMSSTFTDIHTLGDMMIQAHWHEPVLDVSRLLINYSDPSIFSSDLKSFNLNYEVKQTNLTAINWEIIYARAWKKKQGHRPDETGQVSFSVKDLLRSRGQ